MPTGRMTILLLTTVVSFCTLYAPQPILPLLAVETATTQTQIALLITITLIPLGFAPVFYGLVLEALPARQLLRGTVLGLAGLQLAFAYSESYPSMLLLRLLQGLLLPAVFTTLATYCATAAGGRQNGSVMAWYVAATILGGFLGRAITGILAESVGWQWAFRLWALALACCWILLGALSRSKVASPSTPRLAELMRVVATPLLRNGCMVIFSVFFVFASVLNFLPFRLKALDPGISESSIAFAYGGYLVGLLTALGANRLATRLGSQLRALITGWIVLVAGLVAFLLPAPWMLHLAMLVLCSGMFLLHATLNGFLNRHARRYHSMVNGLYIACYYAGGSLGSWLPGLVYRSAGWNVFLVVNLAILMLSAVLIFQLARSSMPRRLSENSDRSEGEPD